jgi:glyoxylase-like metal-dependent hydrolase (beta-lactamase superfamily II)
LIPKTPPLSEHFTYHELAEGVWAAIVISTGLAASNSGIVDLGDRTLIFDATLSPVSALDLRKTAEGLTGRSVAYVFNSHWDIDHVFGNSVFAADTEIYATARTSEYMSQKTALDIAEFKNKWPELQSKWREGARNAKDEAERIDYEEGVQFAQRVIDTFPQLELRLPNKTISDRMEFKGNKRSAEFITFGGGHTDSDAFLYLPGERIIFTGDLVVVKNHPGMSNGHPREWLNILAKIKALDPVCLVPGHGELGTLADIELIERYLNELLQMAEQNVRDGGTAESAAELQLPAFTEGWNNSEGFGLNMKFLHEEIQRK